MHGNRESADFCLHISAENPLSSVRRYSETSSASGWKRHQGGPLQADAEGAQMQADHHHSLSARGPDRNHDVLPTQLPDNTDHIVSQPFRNGADRSSHRRRGSEVFDYMIHCDKVEDQLSEISEQSAFTAERSPLASRVQVQDKSRNMHMSGSDGPHMQTISCSPLVDETTCSSFACSIDSSHSSSWNEMRPHAVEIGMKRSAYFAEKQMLPAQRNDQKTHSLDADKRRANKAKEL